MIAKRISGFNVELAKDQEEFHTLPARARPLGGGFWEFTTSWEPTPDELVKLLGGAAVELSVMCHQHPPVKISVGEVPVLEEPVDEV